MPVFRILVLTLTIAPSLANALEVGFAEADITPKVDGEKKVWIAGYGPGRDAEGVHDPIMARGIVLKDEGSKKIAIVSVDLVGLQYPEVKRIRAELSDFTYVLVTSTHNHEGPDVIGIWGKTPFQRGVDPAYLELVVNRCVKLVREAESDMTAAEARIGTASDQNLLSDSRLPKAYDSILRAIEFRKPGTEKPVGLLVQWNCHPEALGSKNKLLTADFSWATVDELEKKHECPVVYFTGTVGGLMAPPSGRLTGPDGNKLVEGEFAFAEGYGRAVAELATKALDAAGGVTLTPFEVSASVIYVPTKNSYYRLARAMGVLHRDAFAWAGDPLKKGDPLNEKNADAVMAIETEVACVNLGEVALACIPGEIYPELVYGEFQDPAEPNADYPNAPLEPTVSEIMSADNWMLVGLANDEIGYIIPKRQWDARRPFAYGRSKPQYGEINSCGPDVAGMVMEALKRCVNAAGE